MMKMADVALAAVVASGLTHGADSAHASALLNLNFTVHSYRPSDGPYPYQNTPLGEVGKAPYNLAFPLDLTGTATFSEDDDRKLSLQSFDLDLGSIRLDKSYVSARSIGAVYTLGDFFFEFMLNLPEYRGYTSYIGPSDFGSARGGASFTDKNGAIFCNGCVTGTLQVVDGQFLPSAVLVSQAPLPSSAPMFGAALLGLGALGYGMKRRKASGAA